MRSLERSPVSGQLAASFELHLRCIKRSGRGHARQRQYFPAVETARLSKTSKRRHFRENGDLDLGSGVGRWPRPGLLLFAVGR